MPRFMDVHDGFVGVTEDQLREAHQRDLAAQDEENVNFEKTWLDPATGKVFCLATAPSAEAMNRVHEKAGHPTSEVYEVSIEIQ